MEQSPVNEQPNGMVQFLCTMRRGYSRTFRGQKRFSGGSTIAYEVKVSVMVRYDVQDIHDNGNLVGPAPMISVNFTYTSAPPGPLTQTLLDVYNVMQPSNSLFDAGDVSSALLVTGVASFVGVLFVEELGLLCGAAGIFSILMYARMRSVSNKIRGLGEDKCGIIIEELVENKNNKEQYIQMYEKSKQERSRIETIVNKTYEYNWFGRTIGILRKISTFYPF